MNKIVSKIKLEKTSDLGFSLNLSDGKGILIFNIYRWGFIFSILRYGMCINIIEHLFWKGTLKESFYHFSYRSLKPYGFNLNWRIWIVIGEVSIRCPKLNLRKSRESGKQC